AVEQSVPRDRRQILPGLPRSIPCRRYHGLLLGRYGFRSSDRWSRRGELCAGEMRKASAARTAPEIRRKLPRIRFLPQRNAQEAKREKDAPSLTGSTRRPYYTAHLLSAIEVALAWESASSISSTSSSRLRRSRRRSSSIARCSG